jgi:predicted nucleic-acid-binding Zn-ribbon protein
LTEARNKKAKKPFAVKFCPKCGSTDIFWAQGMPQFWSIWDKRPRAFRPNQLLEAQGMPQFWSIWDCRNCGYRGAFILEDGNMAEKLQEEWRTKK